MQLLLIIACICALVVAQTPEEICALHFDDCQACLSDKACGWCGDYCVSKESNLCEIKISHDRTLCPSVDAPVRHQAARQSSCFGQTCVGCNTASGCSYCQFVDPSLQLLSETCLPDSQRAFCTNPIYAPSNSTGFIDATCLTQPTTPVSVTVWFYLSGNPTLFEVQVSVSEALSTVAPVTINANDIVIVIFVVVNVGKRDSSHLGARGAPAGATTAVALYGVTPDPSRYPQHNMDVDLQNLAKPGGVPGLTIVEAGSRGTPSPSGTSTSGHSSSSSVSGGALAGIIIACIIAGLLIAAIAAYIYYRRRSSASYPAPFRSPAASYRP